MIIGPDFFIKPPGRVSLGELVEAAYAGKSPIELAKEVGAPYDVMHRYIKKVWPRYFKVYRSARNYLRYEKRWKRSLASCMGRRSKPFTQCPKTVKDYIRRNLPTYLWPLPTMIGRMQSATLFRPSAGTDLALIRLLNHRLEGERAIDYSNKAAKTGALSRSKRIDASIGITSEPMLDMLVGIERSLWDKKHAKKLLAKRMRDGPPVGKRKVIKKILAQRGALDQ